jgi:hypothetical protein
VIALITVFYAGQVLGVAGSMIMEITVFADKISTPGEGGRWVVKDAAGGLKGLRGEGDWSWTGPKGRGHTPARSAGSSSRHQDSPGSSRNWTPASA